MIQRTLWGGLLAASLLLAQGPRGRMAENLRERQTERMDSLQKLLDLSDDQRTKVEEIERVQMLAMRGAGRDLMEARQALESAKTEAEIDAKAADVGKLTAQVTAARLKADLQIRKLLTPAQAEKFDAWRKSSRPGPGPGR